MRSDSQHAWSVCDTVVSYHSEKLKLGIYYYLKGIFNAHLNCFWRALPWFIGPVGGLERKPHSFQENTDLSHAGIYNPQVNVCVSGGTSEVLSHFTWPPTLAALETQPQLTACNAVTRFSALSFMYAQWCTFKDQGACAPQEKPLPSTHVRVETECNTSEGTRPTPKE